MYICKNCLTSAEENSNQCGTCKMKGQMIQDNTVSIHASKVRKHKVRCTNCGCNDIGNGKKCRACNFPVSVVTTSSVLKQHIK